MRLAVVCGGGVWFGGVYGVCGFGLSEAGYGLMVIASARVVAASSASSASTEVIIA